MEAALSEAIKLLWLKEKPSHEAQRIRSEVGTIDHDDVAPDYVWDLLDIGAQRALTAAREAERNRCAKIAEQYADNPVGDERQETQEAFKRGCTYTCGGSDNASAILDAITGKTEIVYWGPGRIREAERRLWQDATQAGIDPVGLRAYIEGREMAARADEREKYRAVVEAARNRVKFADHVAKRENGTPGPLGLSDRRLREALAALDGDQQ